MREKAVLTFRSLPKSYSVDALLPAKGDDSDSDSSSSDGESESGKAKLGSISLSPFWYSSKLFGQPASYGQSTVHSRYEAGQPSRCPHWQSGKVCFAVLSSFWCFFVFSPLCLLLFAFLVA